MLHRLTRISAFVALIVAIAASVGAHNRVETNGRASKSQFDDAGRLLKRAFGEGTISSGITTAFDSMRVVSHDGALPALMETKEKTGAVYSSEQEHNALGQLTKQTVGSLEWQSVYDSIGSQTQSKPPDRPETSYDTDSRGAVKTETKPGNAVNAFEYDASGVQNDYKDPDPSPQQTHTTTDLLGRPLTRTYPDSTTELVEYEGSRIKSVTDRKGRKQAFGYNGKGQLEKISDGTGVVIDFMTYDSAGRLVSWMNRLTEITWSDFDAEGRPKKTTQKRFTTEVTLPLGSSPPPLLDEYTQTHAWNEHGERTFYSMPLYAGLTLGTGWAKGIQQKYDATGNVILITKADTAAATTGVMLMKAEYRNAGRPNSRTVMAGGTVAIVRNYDYDPAKSLLNKMEVTVGSVVVAGSEVEHDGTQVRDARLLGVSSGERHTQWEYDVRSRLSNSVFGKLHAVWPPSSPFPGRTSEELTKADFRSGQDRAPQLDTAQTSNLTANHIDPATVDPPRTDITERAGDAHKVDKVVKGPKIYPFNFAGGPEVVDDGRFTYTFDVKGRMTIATEKGPAIPIRRIVYAYNGSGRLVGRRAEYTNSSSPISSSWQIENRAPILAADGLPADTTFVWDPISDRLITIAKAGATSSDPQGGILKQIIHGGQSYDDPLETATIDPLTLTPTVNWLYPIYDEAAGGTLQVVLNKTGEVVARSVDGDPYGAQQMTLSGPAIDRVLLKSKSSSSSKTLEITVGATESITASSLAAGVRLTSIDIGGALVRTSTVAPQLVSGDPTSIRWILTETDLNTLMTGAAAMSVTVTNQLRASGWPADQPFLQAPAWASNSVSGSPEVPLEVHEPAAALTALLASAPDDKKLYEVDTLALLATAGGSAADEMVFSARMHAHPFTEPLTGLDYVRARWYQPMSGTWLSPDPRGYADSSNLYSFAGGDPVNGRDPTGECLGFGEGTCADWANAAKKKLEAAKKIVDQHTGSGIVGIAVNATVGTVLDTADAFILDPLRVGEATGEAIGSDAGVVQTSLAIVQDVGRAATVIAGAGTAVKAVGRGAKLARAVLSFEEIGEGVSKGISEGTQLATRELAPEVSKATVALQRAEGADVATLKAIRRHTERLVRGEAEASTPGVARQVRRIQQQIEPGEFSRAGTSYHSLNARLARTAQESGGLRSVVVNRRFAIPEGGVKTYRVPDYRVRSSVLDLKPWRPSADAFDATEQFLDLLHATNIQPLPLYYRIW